MRTRFCILLGVVYTLVLIVTSKTMPDTAARLQGFAIGAAIMSCVAGIFMNRSHANWKEMAGLCDKSIAQCQKAIELNMKYEARCKELQAALDQARAQRHDDGEEWKNG